MVPSETLRGHPGPALVPRASSPCNFPGHFFHPKFLSRALFLAGPWAGGAQDREGPRGTPIPPVTPLTEAR